MAGGERTPLEEITHGRGIDDAFEVIANAVTLRQASDMVRRGLVVAVGVPALDAQLAAPITDRIMGEQVVMGSVYGSVQVATTSPDSSASWPQSRR